MNYALARPANSSRSGLLGIVIGLHAGVFLLVAAAKTVAPQIAEMPLIVDLIQPSAEVQPAQAKPQPVIKPQPQLPKNVAPPKSSTPPLEATRSEVAAPAAPQAAPVDSKPQPPAPPVAAPATTSAPLSQARFDADYLRNPAPAYPPLSRRMGEEGKVVLRVSVTPEGSADNIEIKTSSGSTRLDESALRTVRNWKFIPAKRGDTPVQSWVLVPIIFKLEQ